jgi:hypothetical protein
MKQIFSLLFSLWLFISTGAAQETCQRELKDAPVLLNLKLGATTAEARAVFGKDLKIKNKRSGEYTFFQNFIKNAPPVALANVRALYLRFFDGRLYQIEIFYADETDKTLTLEDFVERQSAKLNLPPSAAAWQIEYGVARLDCGGFSLVADRFLNSRLELTDDATRAAVETSREKKN